MKFNFCCDVTLSFGQYDSPLKRHIALREKYTQGAAFPWSLK